ncbi:MAG: response regulator [Deltaproteobacteria bacterium]|nr:response regulator [Deltaproteobacteria bacterium]
MSHFKDILIQAFKLNKEFDESALSAEQKSLLETADKLQLDFEEKEKAVATANVKAAEAILELEETRDKLQIKSAQQQLLNDTITQMAKETFLETGGDFLNAFVETLSKTFQSDFAFIASYDEAEPDKIDVLSAYGDGHFHAPFECVVQGTPCETIINQQIRIFQTNVQAIFPDSKKLCDLDAQNYCGAPLFDSQGKPIGMIAVVNTNAVNNVELITSVMDIFSLRAAGELERMHFLQELKGLQDQLYQAQKMESIGLLAGGVTHDFNNILNCILGYVSLMQSKLPKDEKLERYLKTITTSAKRGASLTRQLLDYSRCSDPMIEKTNLNDLVEETELLMSAALPKTIELETQKATQLLLAEVDTGRLSQCLINLCVNARDSITKEGKILISTHNQCKTLADGKEQYFVRIDVEDTGGGIPEEVQSKIFDPYFTTKEKGLGTGLGLATIKKIMSEMGGDVSFVTELGKGTTFSLLIPAISSNVTKNNACDEPSLHQNLKTHPQPLSGLSILIVDDEELIRDLLDEAFKAEGAQTHLAQDGIEGLEILKMTDKNFDIVILDVIMPRLDGIGFFKKAKQIAPKLKVLFSSGYAESDELCLLLQSGQTEFIQKPYSESEIIKKMQSLLNANAPDNKAQTNEHPNTPSTQPEK